MELSIANPAFRTYAICSAILVLKVLLSAIYTGVSRQRSQGYANAEDARVFGQAGAAAASLEAPAVAHALRIQRNDAENIPAFFAIGLVYVLTGASPFGAAVYLWTYTITRVLHTIMYMRQIQPWRAIFYFAGLLALVGMAVQVLMRAVAAA